VDPSTTPKISQQRRAQRVQPSVRHRQSDTFRVSRFSCPYLVTTSKQLHIAFWLYKLKGKHLKVMTFEVAS